MLHFNVFWIYCVTVLSYIFIHRSAEGQITLTVEGGVSLIGPHCPGTVRLLCTGINLHYLRWTYNAGKEISDTILPGDQNNSIPHHVNFGSVKVLYIKERGSIANYSSVLTVNLMELKNQNIRSIACSSGEENTTLQVNITRKRSEYFTPNITAAYQFGTINRIKVSWTILPPACSEYDPSSLMYEIRVLGHKLSGDYSCINATCSSIYEEFPTNMSNYDFTIAAMNDSHTLKTVQVTVAYYSNSYFKWSVNLTDCQYSIQCTTANLNVLSSRICNVNYTTDDGLNKIVSLPLDTLQTVPMGPGMVHNFGFFVLVTDSFLVTDYIKNIEPSPIESRTIIFLLFASLFLLLALIHLLLLIMGAICKVLVLISKQQVHTVLTIILLALIFICVALLFAFGIIINNTCYANLKTLVNSLLNILIVTSSLGITCIAIIWLLMACEFCKHRAKKENNNLSKRMLKSKNTNSGSTIKSDVDNYFYCPDSAMVVEGVPYSQSNTRRQLNYNTLERSNEYQKKVETASSQDKAYDYAKLNKETMLADPNDAGHYMQLRPREKSKPVANLTDRSYTSMGKRPHNPDIESSILSENKQDDYHVLEQSFIQQPTSDRADTSYQSIDLAKINPNRGGVYTQLRPGEKSKAVPNFDDPSYSHVHIQDV